MFKLMWSMKKKGDKPHYKPGTDKKYKKYQEDWKPEGIDEAERNWYRGYDSGDKTVPRRKALNRADEFDNRGQNERADKIRSIAAKKDQGRHYEAKKDAKKIKISDKIGKLRPASIDDKRGAVSGDVQKKLKSEDWKPEIEHSKLGDAVKKKAEKKRKEAESSLPPHLRLDAMKKAFAHTNEEKQITPMQDNNLFGNAYAGTPSPKKKKKLKEASFADYMAQAQAARERQQKKQDDRKKRDAEFVDRQKHGIKFYDKKGRGRIVKGKKVYDR